MKNTLLPLLFACLAVSGQAATVTLSSPAAVTPGSAFDVEVQLTNVFGGLDSTDLLLGYGFTVAIGDPSVIGYTGETASALSSDISAAVSPVIAGVFFPGLGSGDFSEPLTLATLHFTALTAGSTTISVQTDLTDPDQGLTFLESNTQGISAALAVAPAATPEPSTLALGALAMAALMALRRQTSR